MAKTYIIYGTNQLPAGFFKIQKFGNPARDDLYTFESVAGDILYDIGITESEKGYYIEGYLPGIGEIYHFVECGRMEATY